MDLQCTACDVTYEFDGETVPEGIACPQCENLLTALQPEKPKLRLRPPGSPANMHSGLTPPGQLQPPGAAGLTPPGQLQPPGAAGLTPPGQLQPPGAAGLTPPGQLQPPGAAGLTPPGQVQAAEHSYEVNNHLPPVAQADPNCCANCGSGLAPDAILCINCGTRRDGTNVGQAKTAPFNNRQVPQFNYGPQLEIGANVVGTAGKIIMVFMAILSLLFLYALFKNPPRGGSIFGIITTLCIFSYILKISFELNNCAKWMRSRPTTSFKTSCMISVGKVLYYIGGGIAFVSLIAIISMAMAFGGSIGLALKALGPWFIGGILAFGAGKVIVYSSENYQNDHQYDDNKARIFKVLEFIIITVAIYFIVGLVSGPLIGIFSAVFRTSLENWMIFVIAGVTFITWAGFYAYGAYNSIHAVKVEKRPSKLYVFPLIYCIGLIFLIPWIILHLPFSWFKYAVVEPRFNTDWQTWAFFALATIGAPIFEELAFRKNLLPGLVKTYGYWGSVFISAFAFAVAHGNLIQLIPGMFIGVITAYVYLQSGSIIHCMILHFVYNAGVLAVMQGWIPVTKLMLAATGFSLVLGSLVFLAIFHQPFTRESGKKTKRRRRQRALAVS